MKKLILGLILMFSFEQAFAQSNIDWRTMSLDQRKSAIRQMSPESRKELLKKMRQNLVISNLKIEENNQEEFSKIYQDYEEEQRKIRGEFDSDFDPETLSDEEAVKKLHKSFEVGQRLLDSRKKYADRLQRVMPPQQVLKLYKNEGAMRDKMLNRRLEDIRREDSINSRNGNGFRNNHSQEFKNPPGEMRRTNPGFRNAAPSSQRTTTNGARRNSPR